MPDAATSPAPADHPSQGAPLEQRQYDALRALIESKVENLGQGYNHFEERLARAEDAIDAILSAYERDHGPRYAGLERGHKQANERLAALEHIECETRLVALEEKVRPYLRSVEGRDADVSPRLGISTQGLRQDEISRMMQAQDQRIDELRARANAQNNQIDVLRDQLREEGGSHARTAGLQAALDSLRAEMTSLTQRQTGPPYALGLNAMSDEELATALISRLQQGRQLRRATTHALVQAMFNNGVISTDSLSGSPHAVETSSAAGAQRANKRMLPRTEPDEVELSEGPAQKRPRTRQHTVAPVSADLSPRRLRSPLRILEDNSTDVSPEIFEDPFTSSGPPPQPHPREREQQKQQPMRRAPVTAAPEPTRPRTRSARSAADAPAPVAEHDSSTGSHDGDEEKENQGDAHDAVAPVHPSPSPAQRRSERPRRPLARYAEYVTWSEAANKMRSRKRTRPK